MPARYTEKERRRRFWQHVDRTGACWRWTAGGNPDGYGITRVAGRRSVGAHRRAWELLRGEIPAGLQVLHTCDHRWCVRPEHLFLGTQLDNIADMVAKGRSRACGVRGERHHAARLTADDVRAIRASTESGRAVAQRYGITFGQVSHIRTGRKWRHVA